MSTTSAPTATQEDELSASEKDQARVAPDAVKAAEAFADLVAAHRSDAPEDFLEAAAPMLSEMGQSQFTGRGAKAAGFAKRTGKARVMVSEVSAGEQFTSIAVPTDAGYVLMLLEESGQGWVVSSVSHLTGPADE